MKKLFLTLALVPLFLNAQVVKPSSSQLNFGDVFVGERDTLSITLKNEHWDSLKVTGIKFYAIYNETPFSVSDEIFMLPKDSSKIIDVYFEPVQNIWHNSEMVIQHNAKSGFEAIDLLGQGKFSMTYYDTTENMHEEDLKKALNWKLKQGYVDKGYNGARDEMYADIDNDGGDVECVYTGTTATFSTRSGANTNSFNCEHTFPQGFFNSATPERSDIHHLFPTTVSSNSQRGNKPFGKVTNPSYNVGGSKSDASTFEPRNEQKGRTARAMMYFVIRYKDYSNHFRGQENVLRDWHMDYLPDSTEKNRNEDIFALQKNRNPFVDYPQLEERITNFVSTSSAPKQFALDILQSSIDFGSFLNPGKDTFDYVLVNRGNQLIKLSNLALSDTLNFSFGLMSGKDTSVSPGEAIEISVVYENVRSGTFNENLTFDTNIPGSQGSFTIPLYANTVVSIEENKSIDGVNVYPNPLQNHLYIEGLRNQAEINLLDAVGRNIAVQRLSNSLNRIVLSMEELNKGIYFLEIIDGKERVLKKLVK